MAYAVVALYFAGVMSLSGHQPPTDADILLNKAQKGNVQAQKVLADDYVWAKDGIPQNYDEAVKWYRKAADQGNPDAQLQMGFVYLRGLYGQPQDWQQAYYWNSLAASRSGSSDAMERRENAAQHLTPAQLAEADGMIRAWKEQRNKG